MITIGRRILSTGAASAVRRGVAFEERSLRILQENLSMSLRRVGGKSDGGIDIQGWWWLPASSEALFESNSDPGHDRTGSITMRKRLRVLAQCKTEKRKIGPKYIRELEGVLHRHVAELKASSSSRILAPSPGDPGSSPHDVQDPIVGLFISSSPFTKSALLRAQSSLIPFVLLHLPPLPETEAVIRPEAVEAEADSEPSHAEQLGSIVINPALSGATGLLNGEIEARWEHAPDVMNNGRPGLWWNGRPIPSWTPDLIWARECSP